MSSDNHGTKPSVLLAFRAENARSFKDEIELSLLATALAEKQYVCEVPWREGGSPVRVLPTAGVFGANASGKSNLLKVMADMRRYVLNSFRFGVPGGGVPRWPFRLEAQSATLPSRFEVDIVLAGVRHEYGMELNDDGVVQEWAYRYPKGRAALLFHRQGDHIDLGTAERSRSRAVRELLRPNALFLSTAATAGHPVLLPLYDWFSRNLRLAEASSRRSRQMLTAEMLDDESQKESVLRMLRAADLGITDARKQPLAPAVQEAVQRMVRAFLETEDESGQDQSQESNAATELTEVSLLHRGVGTEVGFDRMDESLGTLVWFGLVGPVIDSLRTGAVLLADELDASLHPDLVEHLVRLFQNPETNPRRAQLVFNSHDTTLLGGAVDDRLLGRDQIWFTQKLNDGRTELYPLTRFDPRKQEAIGKRYLDGWYGAKPILAPGDFDSIADLVISENS